MVEMAQNSAGRLPHPFRAADTVRPVVSTRRLIIAALLCGLAILIAFAVQVYIAS